MKLLIIGNSQNFNDSLASRFTNHPRFPATVTVSLHSLLHRVEIDVGSGCGSGAEWTWALECLMADGIVYALV